MLLVRHDDGLQREMPVIGKTFGMLLRKLAHDGLKRGVGGTAPYVLATALAPVSALATLVICGAVAVFYALPIATRAD